MLRSEGAADNLNNVNVLERVLKGCGKWRGESADDAWRARLAKLHATGRELLNLPPQDADASDAHDAEKIERTVFGDVLEAYVAKAMSVSMGRIFRFCNLGLTGDDDDGMDWEVDRVLISDWQFQWSGATRGVGECKSEPCAEPRGMLQVIVNEFYERDPSIDVAVFLKNVSGDGVRRMVLNIQCKAASDPTRHNISQDDLTKFCERTGHFRDQLKKLKESGRSDGVEEIHGLLVTNAVDVDFGAGASKAQINYHACVATSAFFKLLGSKETADSVLASLLADGVVATPAPPASFEPRPFQRELMEAFEEGFLPAYDALRNVGDLAREGRVEDSKAARIKADELLRVRAGKRVPKPIEPRRNADEEPLELLVLSPPDAQGRVYFRFQVVAPCGSGKTVVGAMLAAALQRHSLNTRVMLVVCVAPLITLASQAARGVHSHLRAHHGLIDSRSCLCASKSDGAKDLGVYAPNDAAAWVNTCIAAGPRNSKTCGMVIVGVTINSLPDLAKELKNLDVRGGLLMLDEAHVLAGAFEWPSGKGTTIVAQTRRFREAAHLFELTVSVTATPRMHEDNHALRGPRPSGTFYGNGLVGAVAPKTGENPDALPANKRQAAEEALENGAEATGELVDLPSNDPRDEDEVGEGSTSTPPPTLRKRRKDRTVAYDPLTFACQNDARGAFGPLLAHLTTDRALRENIIVRFRLVLLHCGGASEEKLDLDPDLQKIHGNWTVVAEDGKVLEVPKVEYRRLVAVQSCLLDIAEGKLTHLVGYASRVSKAEGLCFLIRMVAIYLAKKFESGEGEDLLADGTDLAAAAGILRQLSDNCRRVSYKTKDPRAEIAGFAAANVSFIANVGIMRLGQDVPCIGGVFFADPISSVTDIAQAAGRAARVYGFKMEYYIYVPVQTGLDDLEQPAGEGERIFNRHSSCISFLILLTFARYPGCSWLGYARRSFF